jgi:RNA polymerase sigma factor (TIGR02999 family)
VITLPIVVALPHGYLFCMSDVSEILSAIAQGDPQAASQLLPLVYDELRRLAHHKMRHEAAGQTLEATALVHEAYLRLVGGEKAGDDADTKKRWDGRGHFFAAAAEAMRRILVENARRKHTSKRGGGLARQELNEEHLVAAEPCEDILALDEALDRLAAVDPVKAELVKLRYFAGLTGDQAARALNISTATAERYWAYARAWLLQEISGGLPTVET